MTPKTIQVQGTLREDGILVLDEKPDLPPGRVKVIVEMPGPMERDVNDVISVLERIHTAQALRGYVPRSIEEIDTYLAETRDDGERGRMIEQIQEDCRRQREGQQPSDA